MGGGLAGLSAAAALGSLGWQVDLHEAKPFLGGRATSFPVHPSEPDGERIDNCQHVLLRCCDNLLDFYRRLGVADKIVFHRAIHFVRPGGVVDTLEAGPLPKPLHLAGAFARLGFLSWREKAALAFDLRAIESEYRRRDDLDSFALADWLRRRGVSANAYRRFWRPIVVSALNEDPEIASAKAAFQVFAEGMLGSRTSYEMGVPAVGLAELYAAAATGGLGGNVRIHTRSPVERVDPASREADFYVVAAPFEKVPSLLPGLELDLSPFEHSPIVGVHLWYDGPISELPHAALLDRTMQWMFRRGEGYVQCVVSAARGLLGLSRGEIVALAAAELEEFFPAARSRKLMRGHVVKETRATFSIRPGLEAKRPAAETRYPNVFLAGDWTATGWPATMEGAVRAGYRAAEAAAARAGRPARFLSA